MRKLPLWSRSILFLIVLVLLNNAIQPIFVTKEKPGVFVMEQLIEDQEEFDIVILGNSHAYCSFDPVIIDSLLSDTNTINLSSPNLSLAHIALLLRQVVEQGDPPEIVILEAFAFGLEMNELLQVSFFNEYSKTWQPDYLYWIIGYYQEDELLAPLIPLVHQHETWKHVEQLQENFKTVGAKEETITNIVTNDLGYLNEGFRGIPVYMTVNEYQAALQETIPFEPTEINIHALEQILALSKKYGFEVLIVQAPYITGYQSNYSSMHDLSSNYGVPIYLLNETNANQYSRFDFMNKTHLNSHGAIAATVTLAEIVSREFDRTIDQSVITSYQQLKLKDITVQHEDDQVLVTLVPASPNVNWYVDWDFLLWEQHVVQSQSSPSLSFRFPSEYLDTTTAHLIITIMQEGFDYPLIVRLQPKNLTSP